MKHTHLSLPLAAATLGAMSGMRSMSAAAFLSVHLARQRKRNGARGLGRLLSLPGIAAALSVLSAGEFVADKLPFVPRRTELKSLLARTVSGALVASAVPTRRKQSAAVPALIGATAAITFTIGAYYARRALGRKLRVPDVAIALVEDAVVLATGTAITHALRREQRRMFGPSR